MPPTTPKVVVGIFPIINLSNTSNNFYRRRFINKRRMNR